MAMTYAVHIIAYGIGTNLYIVAITADIKRHLSVINDDIKCGTIDCVNMHRQILEYIQLHCDSKQLSFVHNFIFLLGN